MKVDVWSFTYDECKHEKVLYVFLFRIFIHSSSVFVFGFFQFLKGHISSCALKQNQLTVCFSSDTSDPNLNFFVFQAKDEL